MTVDWTPRAIEHLGQIEAHLSRYSVESAKRTVRTLLRSTRGLEKLPRSHRIVPEWNHEALRELIVEERYRVIYQIRSDHIAVIAVFDTRQDPAKLEELRPKDR
jgi:plasmid stabilization system protein ParE